jgi:transcriptional regulator of NAD metabolism
VYAGVCYTDNITTRNQVYVAQECLKKEIEKSINIAKRYENFNNELLIALKNYATTRAKCNKYYIIGKYSSEQMYSSRKNTFCRLMKQSKKELREVESRSAVLDNLYVEFKKQIIMLKDELELVELNYALIKGR